MLTIFAYPVGTVQKSFYRYLLPLLWNHCLYLLQTVFSNIIASVAKNHALNDTTSTSHKIWIRSTLCLGEYVEGLSQIL